MKTLGAIILAGGKSSRMGFDKSFLVINGKEMIVHVIDATKVVAPSPIIISNTKGYKNFGLDVFPDEIKDKGPMGGIYTGLGLSSHDLNLVLSCDTPFVPHKWLLHLAENAIADKITISSYKGKLHPLVGIYPKNIKAELRKSLNSGKLKLTEFVMEQPHEIIEAFGFNGISGTSFFNINSLKDLNIFEHER